MLSNSCAASFLYAYVYVLAASPLCVTLFYFPVFFIRISDIMDDDIICPYGENERKFILADSFGCWDEGKYIGQASKETIAKMPKTN